MYLTRLSLDPRHSLVRRDLSSPYNMHRTLSKAFASEEGVERFLWRLEAGSTWANPVVLVQSASMGNWNPLEGAEEFLRCQPESKQVDLDKVIVEGKSLRFRLHANPTISKAQTGKRVALCGESTQLEWLSRQGERHGFDVTMALVSGEEWILDRERGNGKRLSLLKVCFDGLLVVKDPEACRKALVAGVGPAKAFGLGLLSVA